MKYRELMQQTAPQEQQHLLVDSLWFGCGVTLDVRLKNAISRSLFMETL